MTPRQIVDELWRRFEAGDLDSLDEVSHQDVEMTMPGVKLRGTDQLRPLLEAYRAAFPDLKHEVLDATGADDKIAVELRVTGTHTGTMVTPAGEIPATGRPVVWESVDFITIREGKIASWHAYFDQLAFLTQLGLAPAPAGV